MIDKQKNHHQGWLTFYFYFHFIVFFISILSIIFIVGLSIFGLVDLSLARLNAPLNFIHIIPTILANMVIGQIVKQINLKTKNGKTIIIKWYWLYILLLTLNFIFLLIQVSIKITLWPLLLLLWILWHILWLIYFYRSKKVYVYFNNRDHSVPSE